MVLLIVWISAMCIYPIILQHTTFYYMCIIYNCFDPLIVWTNLQILYWLHNTVKYFSNCMLDHGNSYLCNLKWRCVDVHEATICKFVFRGDVTNFAHLMHSLMSLNVVSKYPLQIKVSWTLISVIVMDRRLCERMYKMSGNRPLEHH